jgi:HlyD family secretion protein
MKVRTLAWIGVGAVAAAIATYAVVRREPVAVELASVDRGPVRVSVEGLGKTRVQERFEVRAAVSGQLERIDLHAGDPVRRGTVVARIAGPQAAPHDPRMRSELEARLAGTRAAEARARAVLEQARVAAAQADRDLGRAQTLGAAQVIPQSDVETARTRDRERREEVRIAEAALRQSSAEVAAAAAALGATGGSGRPVEVRSPADGAVLRVVRESGGPVQAGTPLLEVGDVRRLEIVADLPSADAVRVAPGDAALVTGWGGDRPLAARVRYAEPSGFTKVSPLGVEEQRVNVILDPEGDGWEALGDAFAVDVSIAVEEVSDALRIPSSSLFRDGDRWAVYRVEGGKARRRTVEVRARAGTVTALERGLEPGDRVIVFPGDRVGDGAPVRSE